ncbi:MAG: hypothetical protein NT001_04700, partial [Candidatus Woesearchaeota archaeon]|nr:hypothetical protein [Candidatus Woesearchaeota archaeon]
MREISLDKFIIDSKNDISRFLANGWVVNPIIKLICAPDVNLKKVIAVQKGVDEAIQEVNTNHRIVYDSIPQIFHIVYSSCPPGKPLDQSILIKKMFIRVNGKTKEDDHLEIDWDYSRPGP